MLDVFVDSALHVVIGAFMEGESKLLAETAEVNNPKNLEMHKSGFELVEIPEIQLRSCFTVQLIRTLDSVRNMQAAKNVQAVVSKPQRPRKTTPRMLQTSFAMKKRSHN